MKKETAAIIHILNVHFNPEKVSLDPAFFHGLNWPKLEKILEFHAVRPLVYEHLKNATIDVPSSFMIKLKRFTQSQVMMNLMNGIEIQRLQELFTENEIELRLFKGLQFQNRLYENGFLREGGDLDLLVKPELAASAMKLLRLNGYSFSISTKGFSEEEFIDLSAEAKDQYEIPLFKDSQHVDLHWGLHYGFLPYTIPRDLIMSITSERERIFWTLLTHHGGKEFWLRLKNLTDFGAFIVKYGEDFNWAITIEKAKEFKQHTILLNGLYMLKTVFNLTLPKSLNLELQDFKHTCLKESLAYMSKGVHWGKPVPRLYFESILIKSQDKGFSRKAYYYNFFISYGSPNPIETGRFITFPERFRILNFISKLFSYLIKKTFGIK